MRFTTMGRLALIFRCWLLVLCFVAVPAVARATVDGGTTAGLLMLSGEGHRFATVLESDVQEECYRGCLVYHVDLQRPDFARLLPRTIQYGFDQASLTAEQFFERYLLLLPVAERIALAKTPLAATELPRVAATGLAGNVVVEALGKRFEVRLKLLWNVASANFYDRYQESSQRCVDVYRDQPLCSSCRKVVRWLDGRPMQTWECGAQGTRLDGAVIEGTGPDEPAMPKPCRCDARARMYVVEISDEQRTVQGSKVLVEPFRTWQDTAGLPGSWYDDTSLNYATGQSTLDFVLTPEGYLIGIGEAAHLPAGNGTYFPVFVKIKVQDTPPPATSAR